MAAVVEGEEGRRLWRPSGEEGTMEERRGTGGRWRANHGGSGSWHTAIARGGEEGKNPGWIPCWKNQNPNPKRWVSIGYIRK